MHQVLKWFCWVSKSEGLDPKHGREKNAKVWTRKEDNGRVGQETKVS
jgi:hypothetical protein